MRPKVGGYQPKTPRQRKRQLLPDVEHVADLGPSLYEIRWPQRRWLTVTQIGERYEKACRDGLILDRCRNCTTTPEMAEALNASGHFVLTGNTK